MSGGVRFTTEVTKLLEAREGRKALLERALMERRRNMMCQDKEKKS